ncbi:Phosphatidate cytidylyltransferase [Cyanidiococcus yangmingshanensis]|uniref:phytol kinase n=1 Tax=Cyanidiococcus yangmingshanensis TaxID=2690220 RepID=A0A7J7IGF3_9RHOD|nr:Phosphatidate cytidylyltransferase [Cyanidiococcus yangmingshanensis]
MAACQHCGRCNVRAGFCVGLTCAGWCKGRVLAAQLCQTRTTCLRAGCAWSRHRLLEHERALGNREVRDRCSRKLPTPLATHDSLSCDALPSVAHRCLRVPRTFAEVCSGLGGVLSLRSEVWASALEVERLGAGRDSSLITHDVVVAVLALVGSYAWLKIWDWLATNGYIESTLSRKIVHITSVPLFMLTWPFFSDNHFATGAPITDISLQSWSTFLGLALKSSQGIAAAVPAILSARLILAGLGLSQDTLVNALARQKAAMHKWMQDQLDDRGAPRPSFATNGTVLVQGDRREALQGPLYYCLATTVCTFLFWRGPSPLGILALIQMCVGDGMADLVGRRWRTPKWPLPGGLSRKTIGGTLAYVLSAFLISCSYIAIFHACGCVETGVAAAAGRVAILTVCCAAVELLAPGDDNVTVPLAACLIGSVLFPTI